MVLEMNEGGVGRGHEAVRQDDEVRQVRAVEVDLGGQVRIEAILASELESLNLLWLKPGVWREDRERRGEERVPGEEEPAVLVELAEVREPERRAPSAAQDEPVGDVDDSRDAGRELVIEEVALAVVAEPSDQPDAVVGEGNL